MAHPVTDAFDLLPYLTDPILSTLSNQKYVFLKTKVDYPLLRIFATKSNSDGEQRLGKQQQQGHQRLTEINCYWLFLLWVSASCCACNNEWVQQSFVRNNVSAYSVYDNTWRWLGFKPKHVVIHVFNKIRWNIVANEGFFFFFFFLWKCRPTSVKKGSSSLCNFWTNLNFWLVHPVALYPKKWIKTPLYATIFAWPLFRHVCLNLNGDYINIYIYIHILYPVVTIYFNKWSFLLFITKRFLQ
jgi:hypothetical protein